MNKPVKKLQSGKETREPRKIAVIEHLQPRVLYSADVFLGLAPDPEQQDDYPQSYTQQWDQSRTVSSAEKSVVHERNSEDRGFEIADFKKVIAAFASEPSVIDISSGVELNADDGNNSYLIANDGGEILGGATEVTIETTFAGQQSTVSSSLISYAASTEISTEISVIEFTIDNQIYGISKKNYQRSLAQLDRDFANDEDANRIRANFDNEALFGLTFSATAGKPSWGLRGGSLMASVLASTPMWTSIDPVRVLSGTKTNVRADSVEKMFDK